VKGALVDFCGAPWAVGDVRRVLISNVRRCSISDLGVVRAAGFFTDEHRGAMLQHSARSGPDRRGGGVVTLSGPEKSGRVAADH
jgi:hypothetical protein